MTQYLIYFNQQWVGDHPEEWFASRGPLARAVVEQMQQAGVLVVAGGMEEDMASAITADATSGSLVLRDGQFAPGQEYLGGMTLIDVATEAEARTWAGKVAVACGWPQEVRRFHGFTP